MDNPLSTDRNNTGCHKPTQRKSDYRHTNDHTKNLLHPVHR